MSVYRWIGLQSLKIGAVNLASVAGYMPTTFTTVENIVPGSARFVRELGDITNLYVEDSRDPDMSFATGEVSGLLEFATRDMDFDNFILGWGGAVASSVYSFPTTDTTIMEKSVQGITDLLSGFRFKIQMPRVSLRIGAELRFFKREPDSGILTYNATLLKATTDGGTVVAPFKITRLNT